MKKFTSLLMLLCLMTFSVQSSFAEGEAEEAPEEMESAVDLADSNAIDSNAAVSEEAAVVEEAPEAEVEESGLQVLKKKFIEGGPGFMALPLICLILGLAIAIERIISLFWMSINTDKFVAEIESEVVAGNLEGAKEICRNTRGPVASIFYQGLDRASQGGTIDVVEKSVVSYGSVQMGQLEKGLVWLSLFIALAPMLGFMGTVIGMIGAFDAIKAAGDISPGVVADGISVALLTTVAGLIVAIILQVFYNFITSKIDGIVNKMEDSSISLVDMLVKNKAVKG
ncbi:MAG: biopolymer transport protein ExbB [Bacteroidia bacterium]|jgi:biopolymer transport protein ExbB